MFVFRTKDIIPIMDNTTINPQKSIYDFKDDDSLDESMHLYIDESPQPKKKKSTVDWSQKMLVDEDNRANGIESLLKASALATKFIDT